MKRLILPVLAGLFLVGYGTSQISQVSKHVERATPVPGLSQYALGEPIRSGNVTVVPVILRKDIKPYGGDYVTLSEAKQRGTIEIIEVPGDQQVNLLRVRNKGHRPIILLGGELLLGGKQDRVVAADTIVGPGETTGVRVYCVEHGRWTGETEKFGYSDTMVPQRVKDEATYGGQQQVWDSVAGYNRVARAKVASGTVQGGLFSPQVQARVKAGLAEVRKGLASHSNVVGVVLAMNGRIESLELFGNPKLFDGSVNPVIKGFLAQAAVEQVARRKPVTMDECAAFVRDTLKSRRAILSRSGKSLLYDVDNGSNVRGRVLSSPDGKGGGIVHGTYQNQEGKKGGSRGQQQR